MSTPISPVVQMRVTENIFICNQCGKILFWEHGSIDSTFCNKRMGGCGASKQTFVPLQSVLKREEPLPTCFTLDPPTSAEIINGQTLMSPDCCVIEKECPGNHQQAYLAYYSTPGNAYAACPKPSETVRPYQVLSQTFAEMQAKKKKEELLLKEFQSLSTERQEIVANLIQSFKNVKT